MRIICSITLLSGGLLTTAWVALLAYGGWLLTYGAGTAIAALLFP